MSPPFLQIQRIERTLSTGGVEELVFSSGVNLIVGPPNTGKTKWLQTLDFLLGDPGENPFVGEEETGLADKYDAAAAVLVIGGEPIRIERRWREAGNKTKIFVGDTSTNARDFQHWLMERLNIPLVNFPKGNPMSGQSWPDLSFRMLLRHIYRQQRFWGDLADKQPESEQHACLLQFLGLAETVYADEYGKLVDLRTQVERLKSRREQFGQTLNALARDIISEPELSVTVTVGSVQGARRRLNEQIGDLRRRRIALLSEASLRDRPKESQSHITRLARRRAETLKLVEETQRRLGQVQERAAELQRYRMELTSESERIARAKDAGAVLADLKITHCPACDQSVSMTTDSDTCFLCHQPVPGLPAMEELGAVRLKFEHDRLLAEMKEADELLGIVAKDMATLAGALKSSEEELGLIEGELLPAREAVSAFVQEEVSALDVALGQASERERQLGRVAGALDLETEITGQIAALEHEISPLQERVDELVRAADFGAAATKLEDGINSYLNAINALRPDVWRHSPVTVNLSRSNFAIRVGSRRWHSVLGGTDTLYFLMAYQYGLLTLSPDSSTHFPGLVIIDVPGEFSGEEVKDKENFIVQPFVDLLEMEPFRDAQLIMTGASFSGLKGARFIHLSEVYVA